MSENLSENVESPPVISIETGSLQSRASALVGTVVMSNVPGGGHTFPNNCSVVTHRSTPRYLEGATPKIGGISALRSENMIKKVDYNKFCEKLHTYIMNEFKNVDAIVEVTKITTWT